MRVLPLAACAVPSLLTILLGSSVAHAQTAGMGAAAPEPAAPGTVNLGEWQLTPRLQLRTRGEYRRDPVDMGGRDLALQDSPRVRDAWLLIERARLGLGAERGALRAQVTLQDARAWGAGTGAGRAPGDGVFGPQEAFFEVHSASARPAYLRVGRQAVTWGDGRFIGSADWHPVTRSLDAARLHVPLGPFEMEALAVLLVAPQPQSPSFGQRFGAETSGTQLYALSAAWPLDPLLRVELMQFARIARGGVGATPWLTARQTGETYTSAARIAGDSGGFRYAVEGAYQYGTARVAPGEVRRAAYAGAAYVEERVEELMWRPALRLTGSYASGASGPGGSTYGQFDPLLPDVHVFHGAMDLWSWSNVADVGGRVTVEPLTDVQATVEYRYARLAKASGEWVDAYLVPVGRANVNGEAELGHALDVMVAWQPWVPFDLRAGYSTLLKGDGARTVAATQARGFDTGAGITPTRFSHFGYLQATLTLP